jgi:hypothetical protein
LRPSLLLVFVSDGLAILQVLNLVESVKLMQKIVSNRTLTQGRVEGGGRVEPERRLKGQQFTKLGRKFEYD